MTELAAVLKALTEALGDLVQLVDKCTPESFVHPSHHIKSHQIHIEITSNHIKSHQITSLIILYFKLLIPHDPRGAHFSFVLSFQCSVLQVLVQVRLADQHQARG
jgi:hypothetical protein